MKKIDNPLHDEFSSVSGSCALEAVAYIFNLDKDGMLYVTKLARLRKPKEGPTTLEIRKMIRILAIIHKKQFSYTRNTKKLTLKQFVKKHRKGTFIVNFDAHVCAYKNGVLVDGWNPETWNEDLDGWWEIKKKTIPEKSESYWTDIYVPNFYS